MSSSSFDPSLLDAKAEEAPQTHSTELRGLTSAQVEERISQGKINLNTDLKTKSIKELFIENLCTLFNLINLVLSILVLVTGAFKNLTFLGVVFLNTAIGVVQSVRSKRMVDKLTLLATKRVVAIRDGEEVELDLDQIVLDDLVRLGRGDQIPADAVVVSGDAQVNESLLTGESNLIRKQPGSSLMSGSFIDSGMVFARVIHVGADNYVAKINNEAKYVKKVNSEIMNALNAIVRFASVIMIPLGLALFVSSVHESYIKTGPQDLTVMAWLFSGQAPWHSICDAILTTVGALLGMIPQGLVLLTSSVLAIATIRLARRKVLAQQLYCIETLARVDVLCLDKTGTITSGRMQVEGTYPIAVGEFEGEARHGVPAGVSVLDFALANIAQATSMDANETCKALLDHYRDSSVPIKEPRSVIPFSSAKKWSGASFDEGSFIMGAAQFVLFPHAFALVENRVATLADTCRVLVVACVDGFTDEGDMIGEARPVGFVTIRDEIRSSAAETIRYFCEQGVTLNVISGDDPRTVASIARVVGVPGAGQFVDATTLDTPAKIDAAVDRYHVFGRVTPQQKRELVVALKKRGHTVAMTGDGVNDVLALKEADCSVAMAAGSDAARNVAEIVLVDNDFASMPAVVAEGRRSINNLQRSAALFLTKTLFSMGLAALCIAFPPYPFQPITMTLINFFCIGFPSFVLALEPNNSRVSGSFLINVLKKALPAAAAVVISSVACMAASALLGLDEYQLSTFCLVATCSVGAALIWRISWPFTPLRAAVFVFVVAGIGVGITLFPDFFSIAALTWGQAIVLAAIVAVGCLLFFKLANLCETSLERRTRSATGFGRGVRVKLGRRGKSVSSTGSAFRRAVQMGRARVERNRTQRELKRAQSEALRAVETGHEAAVPAKQVEPGRPALTRSAQQRAASRASSVARASASSMKVERSSSGITVKMPAKGARRLKGKPRPKKDDKEIS